MTIATIIAGLQTFAHAVRLWAKSKIGKATIIGLIIFFIVVAFAITVSVKNGQIKKREEQISKQKEEILQLEYSKETLENELNYLKTSRIMKGLYTNSTANIEKVEREKLTRTDYEAINQISNDFYNFYDSYDGDYNYKLSNERKIYKSSAFDSSREILYSKNRGQAGFNKSVSRVGDKNIGVAALV